MPILNPIDAAPLRPPLSGTGLLGVASVVEVVDERPLDGEGNLIKGQVLVSIDGVPYLAPESDLKSRWEGGIEWLPEGWRVAGPAGYRCGTPPDRDGAIDIADIQQFVPFEVWAIDECSTLDWERDRWGRATRSLAAEQSFHVAGELERGAVSAGLSLGNPTLEDGATLLSLSTTHFAEVFIALDDALSRRLRNRQGIVHISPVHLAALEQLGMTVRYAGSTPYTPNGHVIAADAGYESESTEDTSVIYGTDMMRVFLGPIRGRHTEFEDEDLDTNDVTVRAFRSVGIQWDHAAHLAVTTDVGVPLPEFVESS